MIGNLPLPGRRSFLSAAAAISVGAAQVNLATETAFAKDENINIIGPKPGFSPQIGTLVSMLNWVQRPIAGMTKGLTQSNLDYLIDSNANTVGALLLHLAATETYYQMNTFEAKKWDSWPDAVKQKWDPAMNLG